MEKLTLFLLMFFSLEKPYEPCIKLPVLMYHHIQPENTAKKLKQTGLTVSPEFFERDMAYLKTSGYTTIFPTDLINFFDKGVSVPEKSVMITMDDAYEDNYIHAFPILKKYGYKATIFTPTGLVSVMDYLNWREIEEMKNSGLIYFGNHTWSHKSSAAKVDILEKEIGLADKQLNEKTLNNDKVFAYPYGKPSKDAENVLKKYNYKLAFTTVSGNILCKGKRLELPRIRVGNAPLSKFGL